MNRSYEDLHVWQMAIDLAVDVYEITRTFPSDEKYGLTSQIRRAAYSISSNIAEGCSRDGMNEFQHFLSIAQGSLGELKTQLIISQRIKILDEKQFENLIIQINITARMLNALRNSLRKPTSASNQKLETSN